MPYSLSKLFLSFLKLGSVSFGGYLALISMVHDRFVERDKSVSNQLLADMISLSTFLPGPVAVNVVSALGYYLGGISGSILAFFGVLTPAFFFMAILYSIYNNAIEFRLLAAFFNGASFVIVAIIISVGFNMLRKEKPVSWIVLIVPIAFVVLFFFNSYWQLVIILLMAGAVGWIFFHHKYESNNSFKISCWTLFLPLIFFGIVYLLPRENIYLDLAGTFSTVSLTLFGGGYIMIPLLHDLVVMKKQWLTEREFLDAIALGQITPGPILISAAFVGFKQAGFWGGVISTLAIFAPSAFIMVILFNNVKQWLENRHVKSFFYGLRMAVIGMIIYSGVKLMVGMELSWYGVLISAVSFCVLFFYKSNALYLIVAGGLVSIAADFLKL